MRIEVDYNKKPTRTVSSCKKDEAFRIGSSWYSKIYMDDACVKGVRVDNGDTFVERHLIEESGGYPHDDVCPYLHLTSQSFVYIAPDLVADEWASAKVVISAL